MSEPWKTHYTGCPNRRHAVAYPRHACSECRAYERGVKAARDEIDALTHGDPCDCAECRVIVMAQKMIANLMDIPTRGTNSNGGNDHAALS